MYRILINKENGEANFLENEDVVEEPNQLIRILGIDAISFPSFWVGEYNGEMIWHKCSFVNESKTEDLKIQVGNIAVIKIENISHGKYRFHYFDGQNVKTETYGALQQGFLELSKL